MTKSSKQKNITIAEHSNDNLTYLDWFSTKRKTLRKLSQHQHFRSILLNHVLIMQLKLNFILVHKLHEWIYWESNEQKYEKKRIDIVIPSANWIWTNVMKSSTFKFNLKSIFSIFWRFENMLVLKIDFKTIGFLYEVPNQLLLFNE